MRLWKECLLAAHYWLTLPARRRSAVERAACQREPVRVLFYHRVADEHPNDWTIATAAFATQIRWLRRRFDLVSLSEAQRRITAGRNQWPTACITFDDGYGDNCQSALPLLLRHEIPFTYFVSTDFVLNGRPFPHDVAAGHPLRPNTPEELRALAAAGVEIGVHTRSHADLGARLSHDQLVDEIAGAKHDLEDSIGCAVRHFAFPYGQHENLSQAAFRVAYEAGYESACSAYGGYNFPGDDPFHVRRIHADRQFLRFKNWLTIDPRKLQMVTGFETGNYRGQAHAGPLVSPLYHCGDSHEHGC
jgi:peptidoglycan/xylan/chitin deacetylase (PgdA/CDA1 family)